jgi:hypothetical protein
MLAQLLALLGRQARGQAAVDVGLLAPVAERLREPPWAA